MENVFMPSFQKLVENRSATDPRQFFDKATPAELTSPLSRSANPVPKSTPNAAVRKALLQTENEPAEPRNSTPFDTKPQTPTAKQPNGYSGNSKRYQEDRAALDALKQKVDIIQLSFVMSMLGAQGHQDNDPKKWKIPGIGNLTVNGQKWYNLESEQGGIGAVGLVMHAKGMKYPLAIKWLGETFGESIDSDDIKASLASMAPSVKKNFDPPAKVDKNISFVKHYLKFSRKIPEDIIESLVSQGRIYADESRNCVFASEGIAELRSSFDGSGSVKKLVTGSTRRKGFLALPDAALNEMTLAICESAIDAMSYRALNPGRAAISSAGANRAFPRSIAEEAIENGFKVIAAFDADKAGDKASQALFNHFYLKLWLKHKAQVEINKEFDDETLFTLLDTNTVTFQLATQPNEQEDDAFEPSATPTMIEQAPAENTDNRNILFFNKSNPFEDSSNPPIILVSIKKNDKGLPQCSDFPIEVTPKGFEFITQKFGVIRDRPKGEKDWNELLKKSKTQPTPEDSKATPLAL
jgi:hypothetical protein